MEMNSELFEFAGKGNLKGIINLHKGGVDTATHKDEGGNTALMIACYWGHLDTIKFLIEHGSNLNEENTNGKKPLGFACESGMSDVVEYLLKQGADNSVVNQDGETLLMVASMHGNKDTVSALIKSGADVSYQDDLGYTAAMYTAFNQDISIGLEIFKLLLEHDCDWKKINNEEKTIKDYAKEKNSSLILEHLESLSENE